MYELAHHVGLQAGSLEAHSGKVTQLLRQTLLSQEAVVSNAVPDWMGPEDNKVQLQVYLVTFASILSVSALLASQPLRAFG